MHNIKSEADTGYLIMHIKCRPARVQRALFQKMNNCAQLPEAEIRWLNKATDYGYGTYKDYGQAMKSYVNEEN